MAKRRKKNKSKLFSISIVLFIIVAIAAIYIILNKGKIAGYSLVKIETTSTTDSDSEEVVEEKNDEMKVTVEKKFLSYKKDETTQVTVTVNGEEVDISEVSLESSNEDAIEVDETGLVTAVAEGKSTITATKDDLSATVSVRSIIPITSISFTATNSTIRVGKSLQMKLVAKPSDANIETLEYTSSDEEIATVNSNGIVTGVAPGKVEITVTDQYSGIEKTVNLTIIK